MQTQKANYSNEIREIVKEAFDPKRECELKSRDLERSDAPSWQNHLATGIHPPERENYRSKRVIWEIELQAGLFTKYGAHRRR